MKKKLAGLLLVLLLMIPVMSVSAVEVSQDNLDISYTFTDIDGGEISTQSSGKPKLLVFFRTGCSYCKRTLKSISSSEWIKSGETEVCAVEISFQNEDDVRTFQNDHCPEGTIKFATGGDNGIYAVMAYNSAAGDNSNRFTTPLIAMIDAKNKVRYVTTGPMTAAEIEAYLPALNPGEDNTPNPGEGDVSNPGEGNLPNPDEGDIDQPGSDPDKDETAETEGDKVKDKESEKSVLCSHVWETTLVSEATATSDAVIVDRCIKCETVFQYEMLPNSAYAAFLEETAKTILNAKQEEVVISTGIWNSFNRTVFSAIQSRPDVTVTVNYIYKGEPYTLQIPAGTDVSLLMDENGFGGFRYIEKALSTVD